jgi:hypothetical protein
MNQKILLLLTKKSFHKNIKIEKKRPQFSQNFQNPIFQYVLITKQYPIPVRFGQIFFFCGCGSDGSFFLLFSLLHNLFFLGNDDVKKVKMLKTSPIFQKKKTISNPISHSILTQKKYNTQSQYILAARSTGSAAGASSSLLVAASTGAAAGSGSGGGGC